MYDKLLSSTDEFYNNNVNIKIFIKKYIDKLFKRKIEKEHKLIDSENDEMDDFFDKVQKNIKVKNIIKIQTKIRQFLAKKKVEQF